MEDVKFKFPKAVWKKIDEDTIELVEPDTGVRLFDYGGGEWQYYRNGSAYGSMLGAHEGVHTLEEAKARVYSMECDNIEVAYECAAEKVARIADKYVVQ